MRPCWPPVTKACTTAPTTPSATQAQGTSKAFLGADSCCLILGDNLFYGNELQPKLRQAAGRTEGATDRPYRKVITDNADMSAAQIREFERLQQLAQDADEFGCGDGAQRHVHGYLQRPAPIGKSFPIRDGLPDHEP